MSIRGAAGGRCSIPLFDLVFDLLFDPAEVFDPGLRSHREECSIRTAGPGKRRPVGTASGKCSIPSVRSGDDRDPGLPVREGSCHPTAREFPPRDIRIAWLWFRAAHVTR